MWILPKNFQLSSAFAQDMVDSKEDLTLLESNIESSLMWRSKPSPLRTWSRRWKKESWIQHLFSRILKPSLHTSFEAALTSSLAATRANRSQCREIEKEQMTQDTSGLVSGNTQIQLDLLESSLKTCKDIYRLDSQQSSATWKKMVSKRRGAYSQRVKLVPLKRGSEYLYWPTPTTHLAKEKAYPAEWTRNTPTLTAAVHKVEGLPHSSGYVNPTWLEWLMGVPTGLTDIGSWGTQ